MEMTVTLQALDQVIVEALGDPQGRGREEKGVLLRQHRDDITNLAQVLHCHEELE